MVGPEVLVPVAPTIAVVGAGAVGGYYGARLAQHGHRVNFLLRSDFPPVRDRGLQVQSWEGDFSLPPADIGIYDDTAKMPRADLVIVALKTTSEPLYGELISPLLRENTAILSIQNGLGTDERLAELFGPQRVMGGLAFVCINRGGPGIICHTSHGLVRIGEFGGGSSPRTQQIAGMFVESGIRCEVLSSLKKGRWEKLVWNIPFNGLGAALDLTTDKLIGSEAGRTLLAELMTEVMAAARADGVAFDLSTEAMIEKQLRETAKMGAYRSSMQIDRQESRPLEVEAILGEPLRRGTAKGISMPHLEALYQQVRVVDASRLARCT